MNKHLLLSVAVFGGAFVATSADLPTNQWMIGNEVAHTQMVDGKIMLEAVVAAGSNRLFLIQTEVNLLPEAHSVPEANPSSKTTSKPALRLFMNPGNGPIDFGSVKGLHGLIYMASDWRTPSLAQTNRVDILSTKDNTRIVVMVGDNGPIYGSTNSGMTWMVINTPGTYKFSLTFGPNGGGFFATATIHPSPKNQATTNPPAGNWYAVGSAPDGSKLVITKDSSQPAPVLSITHSGGDVVVSWSVAFAGFVLQVNSDLSTTNWVDVTNSVNVVEGENQVIVPSAAGNYFYRLRSQ